MSVELTPSMTKGIIIALKNLIASDKDVKKISPEHREIINKIVDYVNSGRLENFIISNSDAENFFKKSKHSNSWEFSFNYKSEPSNFFISFFKGLFNLMGFRVSSSSLCIKISDFDQNAYSRNMHNNL